MLSQFIEYVLRRAYNAIVGASSKARARQQENTENPQPSETGPSVVIGETIVSRSSKTRTPQAVKVFLETLYRGLFITGTTGSGKTTLLTKLLQWCMEEGKKGKAGIGIVLIDFRGEGLDKILKELAARFTAEELQERLLIYDFRTKSTYGAPNEPVVGFNVYQALSDDPYVTVNIFLEILRQIWGDAALGIRLRDQLRHASLALAMSPSGIYSLVDLEAFFLDAEFRAHVLKGITDPVVVQYWKRFENGKDRESEADAVLNKISPLISSHRRLRASFATKKNKGSIDKFLRTTKAPIILVCADAGSAGKQVAGIICSLFLTAIARAAMPSDVEPGTALPSPLLIACDEFVNYAAACHEQLDELIREGRKFHIVNILLTQSPGLLDSQTRNLVVNVVKNQAYHSAGVEDSNTVAGMLAQEDVPKIVLRTQLQQAKPGEALFLQEGHPLQRIRVSMPPEASVSDEIVRKVRAAALARWGETVEPEITHGSGEAEVSSVIETVGIEEATGIEVRDIPTDAPKRPTRRKKS